MQKQKKTFLINFQTDVTQCYIRKVETSNDDVFSDRFTTFFHTLLHYTPSFNMYEVKVTIYYTEKGIFCGITHQIHTLNWGVEGNCRKMYTYL